MLGFAITSAIVVLIPMLFFIYGMGNLGYKPQTIKEGLKSTWRTLIDLTDDSTMMLVLLLVFLTLWGVQLIQAWFWFA